MSHKMGQTYVFTLCEVITLQVREQKFLKQPLNNPFIPLIRCTRLLEVWKLLDTYV